MSGTGSDPELERNDAQEHSAKPGSPETAEEQEAPIPEAPAKSLDSPAITSPPTVSVQPIPFPEDFPYELPPGFIPISLLPQSEASSLPPRTVSPIQIPASTSPSPVPSPVIPHHVSLDSSFSTPHFPETFFDRPDDVPQTFPADEHHSYGDSPNISESRTRLSHFVHFDEHSEPSEVSSSSPDSPGAINDPLPYPSYSGPRQQGHTSHASPVPIWSTGWTPAHVSPGYDLLEGSAPHTTNHSQNTNWPPPVQAQPWTATRQQHHSSMSNSDPKPTWQRQFSAPENDWGSFPPVQSTKYSTTGNDWGSTGSWKPWDPYYPKPTETWIPGNDSPPVQAQPWGQSHTSLPQRHSSFLDPDGYHQAATSSWQTTSSLPRPYGHIGVHSLPTSTPFEHLSPYIPNPTRRSPPLLSPLTPPISQQTDHVDPVSMHAGQHAAYRVNRPFGLPPQRRPVAPVLPNGSNPFHYEQKYSPDLVYDEMGPHARLWRTYLDECQMHDIEMVDDSKDNVDVLLVFAGLFSAVVTTFVAQTSQALQMPSDNILTSLVYELVNIERASMNGTSVNDVPFSSLTPSTSAPVSSSIVWVNGLWFVSLALSLTTALLSVLVKQWFHQYANMPSGTPRDRSLVRQYRFSGLQDWHVPIIVGLLPVLMHAAVAIFFCGLVVYLLPLNSSIAYIVMGIAATAYAAYICSQGLPIFYPRCPYKTPLSNLISLTFYRIFHWSSSTSPLKDEELFTVNTPSEGIAVDAIHWLYKNSLNPTVRSVVLQSLGGLSSSQTDLFRDKFDDMSEVLLDQESLLYGLVDKKFNENEELTWVLKTEPGVEDKFERVLRSMLVTGSETLYKLDFDWPSSNVPEDLTSKALHAIAGRITSMEVDIDPAPFFFSDKHCSLHLTVWQTLAENILQNNVISPFFFPIPTFHEKFDPDWCQDMLKSLVTKNGPVKEDFVTCTVFTAISWSEPVRDVARCALRTMFYKFDPLRAPPDTKEEYRGSPKWDSKDDLALVLAVINFYCSHDHDDLLGATTHSESLLRHLVIDPKAGTNRAFLFTCLEFVEDFLEGISFDLAQTGIADKTYIFTAIRGLIDANPDQSDDMVPIRDKAIDMCSRMFSASKPLFLAENASSWCDTSFLTMLSRSSFGSWRQSPNLFDVLNTSSPMILLTSDVFINGLKHHIMDAYRVIREQKLCDLLRRHRSVVDFPMTSILVQYISSVVDFLSLNPEAEEFKAAVSYLHEKDNMLTVCIVLALMSTADSSYANPHLGILRKFIQLDPNHAEWRECRAQLRALSRSLREGRSSSEEMVQFHTWVAPRKRKASAAIENVNNILDDFFVGGGFLPESRSHPSAADAVAILSHPVMWRRLLDATPPLLSPSISHSHPNSNSWLANDPGTQLVHLRA